MSQCLWWKWFVRQRQRQEAGIMAQVITTLGTPSPPPLAILSSKAINWSNCLDRTTDGATFRSFQPPYFTNIGIFAVIYTNDHQKNNSKQILLLYIPDRIAGGHLARSLSGTERILTFCSPYKWIWTLANRNVSFYFHLSKYPQD